MGDRLSGIKIVVHATKALEANRPSRRDFRAPGAGIVHCVAVAVPDDGCDAAGVTVTRDRLRFACVRDAVLSAARKNAC